MNSVIITKPETQLSSAAVNISLTWQDLCPVDAGLATLDLFYNIIYVDEQLQHGDCRAGDALMTKSRHN